MGLVRTPARFEVHLIELDPTKGSEIQKTRPCLVVSPDELNASLSTLIVAPMTTGGKPYPTRVPVVFQAVPGRVALDQLRTVDRSRLVKKLGAISLTEAQAVISCLQQLFAM